MPVRDVRGVRAAAPGHIHLDRPPAVVNAAFDFGDHPVAGIAFLPFTTLMYLILYTPGIGLTGWDWLWLGLAVVLDVGNLGKSSYDVTKETGWRSA
jgi:hypothetical protein